MEIIIVNFTLGLVSDLGEQRSDQHKTGQNSIYFFFNTDVTTTHSEERLEYSGFLFQICSANIRIVQSVTLDMTIKYRPYSFQF